MCSLELSGAVPVWPIIEFTEESPYLPLKCLIPAAELTKLAEWTQMWITVLPAESICHFERIIRWQLVHHFSVLLCENGVLFQLGSGCIENLLKLIHIGPKWKWAPKCHILRDMGSLWDICMGASPVVWNNQAWGNKLAELKARYGRGRWFTFKDTHSPPLRVSLSLQNVS